MGDKFVRRQEWRRRWVAYALNANIYLVAVFSILHLHNFHNVLNITNLQVKTEVCHYLKHLILGLVAQNFEIAKKIIGKISQESAWERSC